MHGVERSEVEVGDGRQSESTGAVHHDIHAAELLLRLVEHRGDRTLVRHVRLHADRPPAGSGDHRHRLLGGSRVVGVVHHDGQAVPGEFAGDRPADAP